MVSGTLAPPPPAALVALHRVLARLEDAMTLLAAAAIFFLMLVGVYQIVARTAFNTAIYGYIDYIEQAGVVFAMLGVAYCQRLGAHVRMDLILRGFPLRFLWAMEGLCVLVALIVVAILVETSFETFLRALRIGDSTMDIKLPVWPSKLLVPVALSVLWLRLLIQILDYARLVRHPDAEPLAVPKLETVEEQAKNEIEETLGRTEGGKS
jgi:TRAP-type C4-dicarboxylate transport system permease small subunit